jgi:hypothetical protein
MAIAQTPLIEHRDIEVPRQAVVLQAVIADDQIDLRVGLQQGAAGLYPRCRHKYRQLAVLFDQQGLVAAIAGT